MSRRKHAVLFVSVVLAMAIGLVFSPYCSTSASALVWRKFRKPVPKVEPQTKVQSSPLAVGYGFWYGGETFMPFIKELGVDGTKIYLYWDQLEPQRGVYNWTVLDRFLAQLDEKSEALIALWCTSAWGAKTGLPSSTYKTGSAPKNQADYYRFVFDLVRRCNGKVKYFQNDCEPNSTQCWLGTPEEFTDTLKTFYQAVKAADPAATVIVGGHNGAFTPNGNPLKSEFFDYVFQYGKNYFDVFDLRLYDDCYSIAGRVSWFRNRMASLACVKPIVCTEYGGPHPRQFPTIIGWLTQMYPDLELGDEGLGEELLRRMYRDFDLAPPELQMFLVGCSAELEAKRARIHCRDIVARSILALDAGVQTLWYWNLTSPGEHPLFGKMRLMDEHLDERFPAFYAYQLMAEKLQGYESIRKVAVATGIYAYLIERGANGPLAVVWEDRDLFDGENQPPRTMTVNVGAIFGASTQVTDVFGATNTVNITNGRLTLAVSGTPLFVE